MSGIPGVGGPPHGPVSLSARAQARRERLTGKTPMIRDLPGGMLLIEALVVTGVLVALATYGWHALSPEVYGQATEGGVRMTTAESRRLFGIEVWFAIVTAAAGVVAGAWLMVRHRLEAVRIQFLLVATGILGAVAVWLLGRSTGPGDPALRGRLAEPGTRLELPLDVDSYAMFSIWPIAALIAGAVVVALLDRPAESGDGGGVS